MRKQAARQTKNYIQEYYEAIQCGRIIAGKWIKILYKTLTDRIQSGRYLFDAERADKAVRFIEEFCHHSEGRQDLLKLELWQKAFVSALFGVLNPKTGRRQFREVFLLVARKNGKTLLAAAIAAYVAYIDGEYGSKIFMLAPKLEQSDLCYDAFYQISQMDEDLKEITKKRRSDIYIPEFNTSVKKIAFNSKKSDGFNPMMDINDEMEAWPGERGLRQYEAMGSGTGARKEPIILSTSTAGYEDDGIFDELMTRSTSWLKGGSEEERLLPLLYMMDKPDEWYTREEIAKSNPNLGVSVSWEDFYLEEIAKAKASLSKRAEFLTKYGNIKQNLSIAWLDYVDVQKAVRRGKDGLPVALKLEDFRGCTCVGGVDLSRTTDLTAAVALIEKEGRIHVFAHFWLPEEKYKTAIEVDNVPYGIYKEMGLLSLSPGSVIDYHEVTAWFAMLVKQYKIFPLKVGYDRYSANYFVQEMRDMGFHMDDVFQGTNLTPILSEFEGRLKDGVFEIGDNPLLESHLLNVAVKINIDDNRMKPVKVERKAHIDGAAAVFDALAVRSKYWGDIGHRLQNISA